MKILSVCLVLTFFISCETKNRSEDKDNRQPKTIAVVNYPLYFFAKAIVGDKATVYLPAIESDPYHWKPSARQVSNFQKADLILANGADYEKWMDKVSLPSSKIVFTARNFKDQWIEIEEELTHSHGPEGEHVHSGTASTTWLNFRFALEQATSVHASILLLFPDDAKQINDNFSTLKKELVDLDTRARAAAANFSGQNLLDVSGKFQYFFEAYSLHSLNDHLHSIDIEQPTAIEVLTAHDVSTIISDTQLPVATNTKLMNHQIKVCVFDPCASRPEEGDFISVMKKNLEQLN